VGVLSLCQKLEIMAFDNMEKRLLRGERRGEKE